MTTKNKSLRILFVLYAIVATLMLIARPDGALDTRIYYTQETATDWLFTSDIYNSSHYSIFLYLDIIYILIYSTIGFLLLGKLAFIPGFLDLVENIFILSFMTGTDLPRHLGMVTCLKWISGGVMLAIGVWKYRRTISSLFLRNNEPSS